MRGYKHRHCSLCIDKGDDWGFRLSSCFIAIEPDSVCPLGALQVYNFVPEHTMDNEMTSSSTKHIEYFAAPLSKRVDAIGPFRPGELYSNIFGVENISRE